MNQLKVKIKTIVLLILLGTSLILIYAVLHELGHLLAAKIFGADIIELDLNILSAQIIYDGRNLTRLQHSIVDISGALFPLLISIIALYGSGKTSLVSIASLIFYISCLFSLISFIIPMGNIDTLNFISHSGLNQATVSAVFGLLFLICVSILLSKNNRGKAISIITSLKKGYFVKNSGKYIRQIIVMVCLIAALIILGNLSFTKSEVNRNHIITGSYKFNKATSYPYQFPKFNCSGNDTLTVHVKNLIADSITVTYSTSTNDNEILLLKGNGIMLRENIYDNIIPEKGEIQFVVDGANIKGEIMIYKNK